MQESRKVCFVVSVLMVLGFTATVFAVPSGPGGTIYFTFATPNGTEVRFAYLDVDGDWVPVGDTSVLSTLSLGTRSFGSTLGGNGPGGYAWFNPSTGKQDQDALHSALLLVCAPIDLTQDADSSNPSRNDNFYSGGDFLAIDNTSGTAGYTTLNGGFDPVSGNPEAPHTQIGNFYQCIPVDSGFTPNGEARGISWMASTPASVWVDTDSDGRYTDAIVPTSFDPASIPNYSAGKHGYANLGANGTVNFGAGDEAVTGVVVGNYAAGATWDFTYKKTAGGYATVVGASSSGYDNGTPGWQLGDYVPNSANNNRGICVGDTDGDGKVDLYYPTLTLGTYRIAHAEDNNGDGDILDANECDLNNNLQHGGVYQYDMSLVQANDGKWALIMFSSGSTYDAMPKYDAYVRIAGLDANGIYDGAGITTISYVQVDAGGNVTGDAGLANLKVAAGSVFSNVLFVPLGSGPAAPAGFMVVVR